MTTPPTRDELKQWPLFPQGELVYEERFCTKCKRAMTRMVQNEITGEQWVCIVCHAIAR